VQQLAGNNTLLLQTLHQMRNEKHELEERLNGLEKQSGTLIAENIKLSSALISASKRARTDSHAAAAQRLGLRHVASHLGLAHHTVSRRGL
jgi:hypothetical protein